MTDTDFLDDIKHKLYLYIGSVSNLEVDDDDCCGIDPYGVLQESIDFMSDLMKEVELRINEKKKETT